MKKKLSCETKLSFEIMTNAKWGMRPFALYHGINTHLLCFIWIGTCSSPFGSFHSTRIHLDHKPLDHFQQVQIDMFKSTWFDSLVSTPRGSIPFGSFAVGLTHTCKSIWIDSSDSRPFGRTPLDQFQLIQPNACDSIWFESSDSKPWGGIIWVNSN